MSPDEKRDWWMRRVYHVLSGHPKGLSVQQVMNRTTLSAQHSRYILGLLEEGGYITTVCLRPVQRWANGEPKP